MRQKPRAVKKNLHGCRAANRRAVRRAQTGARIGQDAEIVIDQLRTIDKTRLGNRIDAIGEAAAAEVRHVITLMYGVLSVRA